VAKIFTNICISIITNNRKKAAVFVHFAQNIPKMIIFGVYIVSKSGGLIFNLDNNVPRIEHEKTFTYPLDLVLDYDPKKVSVVFNRKDGINGRRLLLFFTIIS